MSGALEIRRLGERDPCDTFESGHPALDDYFRRYAKQHQRRNLSATSVAVVDGAIVGYVTVTPRSIDPVRLRGLVRALPRLPVSVLLLARMATAKAFARRGIGSALLVDAVFAKALALADGFGCVGVLTDSKAGAVEFYRRFDFVDIQPEPPPTDAAEASYPPRELTSPMFLEIGVIRAAVASTPRFAVAAAP